MSSSPDLLRTALAPCITYAFDLDDTLHSFRAASSAAATAVFEHIVASTNNKDLHQSGSNITAIDVPHLRALYATILKAKTANAFADGATRTSDDYRKERFAALLRAADLSLARPKPPSSPPSPSASASPNDELESSPYLTALAATYKTALRASLALKPGAAPLLRALKARGNRVVVVTEGPRDAQVWTLRELGLLKETGGYVDDVVTTGDVGRAKVEEGFWGEVLRRISGGGGDDRVLRAEEVAVVGDSWERDVVPAREAGCVVVWYCEGGGGDGAVGEEGRDGVLRVDALDRLREVVETESGA